MFEDKEFIIFATEKKMAVQVGYDEFPIKAYLYWELKPQKESGNYTL